MRLTLVPSVEIVSERLLTAEELGDRLAVPKTWILESARSGAMPCVRLGRYVRFDMADVEAWLEECKRPGRPIALRRAGASA
jgi:excisionase family DNA binding protein